MNKNDHNYQKMLRSMPCSFCNMQGDGLVSWHHLKCIGALRNESWSTIPVCNNCHSPVSKFPSCHNAGISKDAQKDALIDLWCNIGMISVQLTSENISNQEFREMGQNHWAALIEKGLI